MLRDAPAALLSTSGFRLVVQRLSAHPEEARSAISKGGRLFQRAARPQICAEESLPLPWTVLVAAEYAGTYSPGAKPGKRRARRNPRPSIRACGATQGGRLDRGTARPSSPRSGRIEGLAGGVGVKPRMETERGFRLIRGGAGRLDVRQLPCTGHALIPQHSWEKTQETDV